MNWEFLDHGFWQTLITVVAVMTAYTVGVRQIKVQDTVELYASLFHLDNKNLQTEAVTTMPYILVQNVGTRLVYLDKYIFNGREYLTDSQILPSTYSQAQNNFYRIELPTNGELYVSLDVFYHDLDSRTWNSKVIAVKTGMFGWEIKTLPRIEVTHKK